MSRSFCRPDLSRYSATTCEPGASEVFTHGLTLKPFASALRASSPAPIITFGFEVLVQEVIAAITTSPWPRSCLRPSTGTRFGGPALEKLLSSEVASDGCRSKMSLPPSPPLLNSFSIATAKPALTSLRDAVLRDAWVRQRGLDLRQFELEHVGEHRVGRRLGAIHALRLGIGGNQRDLRGRPAGIGEIAQRIVVDREEAAGRAVFGRHVADGGAIRDRQIGEPGPENSTNLPTTPRLRSICVTVSTRSVAVTPSLSLPVKLHADHFRQQHGIGLAEHGRFRLDAADAPAEHREAIDHGGVRIGADQRVRIGDIDRQACRRS